MGMADRIARLEALIAKSGLLTPPVEPREERVAEWYTLADKIRAQSDEQFAAQLKQAARRPNAELLVPLLHRVRSGEFVQW